MKKNKYVTGVRFLKGYDIENDRVIQRIDVLLGRVIKEGAQDVSFRPDMQYSFSYHPESDTPKGIAHCLRSLAYKIQKLDTLITK